MDAPAESEAYAKLKTGGVACEDVADLVQLACAVFGWGAPSRVHLHLVPPPAAGGGAAPSTEEERRALGSAALFPAASLRNAGVNTGALLLARMVTAPARARGPAGVRALSVSEVVGPTFEHEAREVLSSIFREICPWATDVSRLLSRTLDRDGNAREADVMCYVEGDTLGPCAGLPISGVSVVAPEAGAEAPPLPAAALRADARFSPTDATRLGPHKYFLAEVYSGVKEETMQGKVAQLETLCAFLRSRWMDQHADEGGGGGAPAVIDATQLLGAVALVFSAGDGLRRVILDKALRLVAHTAVGANLARLRAAGRLLVVVLDKTQSPATFFQRDVAANLGRLATVPEDIDAVRSELGAVRAGLQALLGQRG